MATRVGLVVGHEPELIEALVARAAREPGIEVGFVSIGVTGPAHVGSWDAIVDRMSTRVPHYRAHLKAEVLAGVPVLNDPFRASALDGFSALALAARHGALVAPTALLPQKNFGPMVLAERDLGNLEHPLRWDVLGSRIGYPAVLRAASDARVLGRVLEPVGLVSAFDHSGESPLLVQRDVGGLAVRALVAGEVVVLDADVQDPLLRARSEETGRLVADALGYELCAIHLAVADNAVYVVAADDPAPVLDPAALGPRFDALVDGLLRRALSIARGTGARTPLGR